MTTDLPTEFAPAKVNLTLHVTGQRDDGYHLLDSLVMFANVGDVLSIAADGKSQLSIDGPESEAVPSDATNSILRAAAHVGASASFHLTKNLPSMAGIGGGTADAAAAFRLLEKTGQGTPCPAPQTAVIGADVPVCMASQTTHMRGIGEDMTFYPDLPALHAVLVNPRIAVPTPDVFRALVRKTNSPMPPIPDNLNSASALIAWLSDQRNDLQDPAVALFPDIGTCLGTIAQSEGCKLARMSGSGATCFGLYETENAAQTAAKLLASHDPDWWVQPCTLGG